MTPRTERIEAEELRRKRAEFEAGLIHRVKLTRKDVEYLIASRSVLVARGTEMPPLNLSGKDLSDEDLSGLNFFEANFHESICQRTNFKKCNLRRANFHGATLSSSEFQNADLEEANLCAACICGSKFFVARMAKSNLSGACAENAEGLDLKITDDAITCFGNLTGANVSGIHLTHQSIEPIVIPE